MILVLILVLCCSFVLGMWSFERDYDEIAHVFLVIFTICLAAFVVAAPISLFCTATADSTFAEYQQTRESLVYQLENNLYDNDNDLGKKELYNQITEYNRDVVSGREKHDNFWLKPFYPDIYDDLELIKFGGK